MAKTEDLAQKKITPLLFSLAIPAIVAQIVNLLYNMVDRIYIGNMENGTVAMAGLAVALPIVTLIMAFTSLIGTGGAPLAAIKLGENNQKAAEKIMTTSFSSLILCSIILTLGIELFKEPLLILFGADETTLVPAMEYLSIYALGTIFVQISQGMNSYINTQGYAKIGMATVLIGAIINIVLDPIFIFGLNMGVKGAALATIISQAVSAIWVLYFMIKSSPLKIRKEFMIPEVKILGSIMALGISPFIMMLTESLLQISFNNQLAKFGGSMAVGTMAILLSLYQMVNMPLSGFCQGAQPILSYNYGAGNIERVKKTFRLCFAVCFGYSFLVTGTIMLFSSSFARIFSGDASTIQFASWALRVYLFGGLFFGAQISCQQAFMAMGQAKRSLAMALFRKVFLLIPLIYILPVLIGNTSFAINMAKPIAAMANQPGNVFAVLFAETISDIVASLTTSILFFRFYRTALVKKNVN